MAPLYLGIQFANNFLGVYTSKYSSNVFKNDTFIGTIITSLVSGVIAMLFFLILSNFNLSGINLRTIIYALIFTAQCYFGYVTSLIIYNYLSVIDNMLISGLFSVVMTTLYSTIIFKEVLDVRTIFSIILRAMAVVLSFLGGKKNVKIVKEEKTSNKSKFKKGVLLALLIAFVQGLGGIKNKFYSIDLNKGIVANSSVYFFITNVIIFAVALAVSIFFLALKRKQFLGHLKGFNKKAIPILVVRTLSSNTSSIINMLLYTVLPIMVLSPIGAMTTMLSNLIVSLIFKEKINFLRVLALIFTVLAAVVMVIPF